MRRPFWQVSGVVLSSFTLFHGACLAQPSIVPPGQLILDGVRASCWDAPTQVVSAGPQGGYAWYHGMQNLVVLNDDTFRYQPTFLKIFIYAHECGHKVRGNSEDDADCFATKLGRDQGWFPPHAFNLLVQQLAASPGDWTHRPGPLRLAHIQQCYQDPQPAM